MSMQFFSPMSDEVQESNTASGDQQPEQLLPCWKQELFQKVLPS